MVHITILILEYIVYSGLDGGDRVALDERFRDTDAPPRQYDKEDHRFILKGKLSNKIGTLLYLARNSSAKKHKQNICEKLYSDTGPHFAPMEILNCLAQKRGYKVIYPPQQHGIPMKTGAMDDK